MIIRIKNIFPIILALVLFVAVIVTSMSIEKNNKVEETMTSAVQSTQDTTDATQSVQSKPTKNNTEQVGSKDEMKAVWIPYMTLSTSESFSEASFKSKFDAIAQNSKDYGFNALIVHIRPFADSMYPSKIFTWSHILTGTQGKSPDFDPLAYMIEKSHSLGLQFHAWINPLRIQTNNTPKTLSADNLYNKWRNDKTYKNDRYVCDVGNDKYFNPAYPKVQSVIISGIKEIVENYAVDGVQFDDYFYPTTDKSFDDQEYNNYCANVKDNASKLSLKKWRASNINGLISGVYSAIKSVKSEVVFGIAPQCNVQNDTNMGADVKEWGSKSGYVDYLCPQIYVSLNHPVLPFEKSADEWKEIVTNKDIKLYYGLAVYKAGTDADSGTWKNETTILKSQVEYGRKNGCDGFMFYSYDYLDTNQTHDEVQNVINIL